MHPADIRYHPSGSPAELCARDIAAARRARTMLPTLTGEGSPKSLDEGYAIQHLAVRLWDDVIAGWKVGATSHEIQELFRITECISGPVFRQSVYASPARLEAANFHHLMLESEFAFRFAHALMPRAVPYTRAEVLDAVDALMPAFEIVSPRFARLTVDNIPQMIADFCANGGVVLGTPLTAWKDRDLSAQEVRFSIAGKLRQTGTGASVIGDPINALVWMANALRRQGIALSAGQFILTGSTTGIHAPQRGESAVADFGEFGTVEVVFA
jgi:2-keto-4-pentenoate hydratase